MLGSSKSVQNKESKNGIFNWRSGQNKGFKLFHQLHLTPELKKNIQQAVKDGMKEESKNNAA